MKLTNKTTPQARNYQCDKCKSICCHKDMYDEKICYACWKRMKEKEICFNYACEDLDKNTNRCKRKKVCDMQIRKSSLEYSNAIKRW